MNGIYNQSIAIGAVVRTQIARALLWTRQNCMLCTFILIALCQIPISILYFARDGRSKSAPKPKSTDVSVKVEEHKRLEPILPYRTDPFVPFPDDNPAANNMASNDLQANNPAAMSQALSGSNIGGNLAYPGISMSVMKPPMSILPSPTDLFKNLSKLKPTATAKHGTTTPSSATNLANSDAKPAPIPKLQGIVLCRGSRVSVFEIAPGRIVNIKPYQNIPETTLATKSIQDDGVFVVDTMVKDQKPRYVAIGKTVEE